MKKLVKLLVLLTLICIILVSCESESYEVTVEDGYVHINGESTGIREYVEPTLEIYHGYVYVNGSATDIQVYAEPRLENRVRG